MAIAKIDYDPPPTIKAFIRDHTPEELFYSWIVGPVGPLSGDSEFLTPQGWKRIDAYAQGDLVAQWEPDDELMTFVEPTKYIVGYTDKLLHFSNEHSLSMMLSPNHRVVYYDYRGEFQEAPAGYVAQYPSRRRIPTTFTPTGLAGTGLSAPLLRLATAIHADGHFPATSPGSTAQTDVCHIVVRKARKKTRLRELLRAAAVEWKEYVGEARLTEVRFTFHSPYVGKHFDARWWRATALELEIILAEIAHWDGLYEGPDTRFSTTSRLDADFIQYAAHACGGRATISRYDDPRDASWQPIYTVHIAPRGSKKASVWIRDKHVQVTSVPAPGGKQYCFATPSTYFIARHNGRIFVTGNSGKTTGIFFKLIYMAGLQAPSPDGIRRTRAVIVRNTMPQLKDTTLVSWGYWFKDGQAGDWNATDKIFTLRYNDVECIVMFRPLDTPDDVARVLSLEINFAIIDEFVEIPKPIVDALSARLGRYKQPDGTPVTIWGMWGSSNPSTEDVWWYDYLHYGLPDNARYWHQPSGLSEDAENVENLPGKRKYYTNQMKGKSEAWVKQFIEAEWGFSVAGQAVVSGFRSDLHVSKYPLIYNPYLPLIIGTDPGIGGSAMIVGQEDFDGRLMVLDELCQQGMGAQRLIDQRLKPLLRIKYPNAHQVVIALDPAGSSRTQTDESTVKKVFSDSRHGFAMSCESNNRFPLRLNAVDHFVSKFIEGSPALQISPQCITLIRALKGGWRYSADVRKDILKGAEPEKNTYSHPGDAFGYLCRYCHKGVLKQEKHGNTRSPAPWAQPQRLPNYHNR